MPRVGRLRATIICISAHIRTVKAHYMRVYKGGCDSTHSYSFKAHDCEQDLRVFLLTLSDCLRARSCRRGRDAIKGARSTRKTGIASANGARDATRPRPPQQPTSRPWYPRSPPPQENAQVWRRRARAAAREARNAPARRHAPRLLAPTGASLTGPAGDSPDRAGSKPRAAESKLQPLPASARRSSRRALARCVCVCVLPAEEP